MKDSTTTLRQQFVDKKFILFYTLAIIGSYAALLTPVIIGLALRLAEIDPGNKALNLSLVLGIGAFFALIANPIFGKLSDRTRSRFGRRRPWLLGGVIIGTAGLFGIAVANDVLVILFAWCLVQAAYNAVLAALNAVLPDRVPEAQRGTVSGAIGIGTTMGILTGLGLAAAAGQSSFWLFAAPGIFGFVSVVMFLFVLRDSPSEAENKQPYSFVELLRSFWINPVKHTDFTWVWAGRFMVLLGLATLTNYQTYFLTDHLHIPTEEVSARVFVAMLISSVCVIIGSLASGYLSDKLHRRKIFVLGSALMYAVGLFYIALAPDFSHFLIAVTITGAAQGVYFAIDLALASQVLPDKQEAGKGLGILNVANALPQSVAPAIAPLFLAFNGPNNYTSLFTAAAVFALIGAFLIQPVRRVK